MINLLFQLFVIFLKSPYLLYQGVKECRLNKRGEQ
jgi:hypothetical protein